MKKSIVILTSVILSGLAFEGCQKKGPNDPSISIHSRTARVAGDWTVSKYSEVSLGGSETYDGTSWTSTDTGTPEISTVSWTISMDKKGTWTEDKIETKSTTTLTVKVTTVSHDVSSGTWNFTGGVGDHKKRSQLIMYTESNTNTTTVTTTGSPVPIPPTTTTTIYTGSGTLAIQQIYDIDQLKNKEMILVWEGNDSSPNVVTGSMTLSQ
ncbi:MAG: hypothetical protein AABZ32_02890 [Bacteroidota bacterium]